MPSSTSNSNHRIEDRPWLRIWLMVAIVSFGLLTAWELFWRSQGFHPNVRDDPGRWAAVREKLVRQGEQGKKAIALIGASRIQQGMHLDVLQEAVGDAAVAQLAIPGASPIPMLEDLASDPSVTGTVICAVTPEFLFIDSKYGGQAVELWVQRMIGGHQRDKVNGRPYYDGFEDRLSLFFQENFVFTSVAASPRSIARELLQGRWPQPPHWYIRGDRMQIADYSHIDVDGFRASREQLTASSGPVIPPAALPARIAQIRGLVEKIEERGGNVVFVRFPSSGKLREIENERFPRKKYWDVFAKLVGRKAIHFEDHPGLYGYHCPDGSHLTVEDSAKFTKVLVDIIKDDL